MTSTPSPAPTAGAEPNATDPAAQTNAFFDALFGYAPEELHALLWTLPDKRSSWVPLTDGPQPVADRAQHLAQGNRDVYIAVSVAHASGDHAGRIKSDNAAGLMGLWADIDIADPDVHKKWNLPPTVEDAMSLLDACGAPPTLVVHSGHGLQAWWLFKEFLEFDTNEQRLEAAGLAQRWNATLQVHAAERSWVVDSTFDLARVMRVPGTLNRKGSPVMPVRMLTSDGPRYTPDDLEHFCRDQNELVGRGFSARKSYKADDLTLDETIRPDLERFQALLDNDERFEATWKRKRKDIVDQSPSSYDMSLANQAAAAGWPDQEIAALIYYFRRTHGTDPAKALRKDYMDRTIGLAREALARSDANEALDELGEAHEEAVRSGDPDIERETRRAVMDAIGSQWEVEITHVVKYLSEPPSYALVTPIGEFPMGDVDGLLQWHKARAAVAAGLDELLPRFKPVEWDRIVSKIMKVLVKLDVGSEATERGEMAAWLAAYLAARVPVESLAEAATTEYPYIDADERVVLFGPAFRRWLYLTYQERVGNKDLGRRLRQFGCEPDKVNVEGRDGNRTSRGIWRLPAGAGSGS